MEFSESIFRKRIADALPAQRHAATAGGDAPPAAAECVTVNVRDLLRIRNDEEFVQEAYRRVMGRESDAGGFVNCLELLRRGIPRSAVLRDLVNSEEARQRGMKVAGMPAAEFPPSRVTRSWVGRVLYILRRLWFAPFNSLENKLSLVLREVATRTGDQSKKTSLAIARLSDGQRQILDELARQGRLVMELSEALRPALAEGPPRGLVGGSPRNGTPAGMDFNAGPDDPDGSVLARRFRDLVRPGMVVVDIIDPSIGPGCTAKVWGADGTESTVEMRLPAGSDNCALLEPPMRATPVTLDEALSSAPCVDLVRIPDSEWAPSILRGMQGTIRRSPGLRVLMRFSPGLLRKAGVEPYGFLRELSSLGLDVSLIHGENGELAQLCERGVGDASSAVLELARRPSGGRD